MDKIIIVIPIIRKPALTTELIIKQMMTQMQILLDIGAIKGNLDDIILDYKILESSGYIDVVVPKDCLVWVNKLTTIGAGMERAEGTQVLEFPKDKIPANIDLADDDSGFKVFSTTTINDRLRMANMSPKLRFRSTIMDYKRYWNTNSNKILNNPDLLLKLRNVFLTDIMGMFTEVLPYIEEGKQLSVLVGTDQVTTELSKVSRSLSLAYKNALRSSKKSGQINKSIYTKLRDSYSEFMKILMDNVFPGMSESSATDAENNANAEQEIPQDINPAEMVNQVEESKHYSYTSEGRIRMFK